MRRTRRPSEGRSQRLSAWRSGSKRRPPTSAATRTPVERGHGREGDSRHRDQPDDRAECDDREENLTLLGHPAEQHHDGPAEHHVDDPAKGMNDQVRRAWTIIISGRLRLRDYGRCVRPRGDSGTFAPFWRASDRPIAIACLRLLTLLPLFPLRSVPSFRLCIASRTKDCAFFPYLATAINLLLREPLGHQAVSSSRFTFVTWRSLPPAGSGCT